MSLDKWNDFLANWAEALKGYGIPINFVVGSRADKTNVNFNGEEHPFVNMQTPGYGKRAEYMARQKEAVEKRKGLPPRWENDGASCFLCDNVGQAVASQINPDIPANKIYELGRNLILPCKYPSFLGHSLFVPKEHDSPENRVIPSNGVYTVQTGKTRGAITTPDYLDSLVEACNEYSLMGISNHVLDGMSIPGHKHFHLYPEDLSLFSLVDYILEGKQQTDFGEFIYRSRNTPFDTLIIQNKNRESFVERACSALAKLEAGNQVFTMLYTGNKDSNLIISPRKKSESIVQNLKCGGGLTFHSLDKLDGEYIGRIKEWVPMKGEYHWDKYF